MSTGAWVVVAAVALALGLGCFRALTDGRFRGTHRVRDVAPVVEPVEPVEAPWSHVAAALPGATLGEKATLLQFSSAFCAPCRATRRTLSEVAELVPGVEHVEVDAEHHLELVRRLGILRTPTTVVLDRAGREVTRAAGAPRKEQVLAALGRAE
ncbi:thioredoxin family protein [Nocardioides sp. SR21]|uniref:thioredoxin family protein n=1 Tax=Nocardioides sp. SR21 TaxID=2919501 RepID=UPI001FA99863|nr:thioredoxin family protein [Nocardioides sp. SR21]